MKLLDFNKDKLGLAVVVPEDKEDLWNLYNVIQVGDHIKLRTYRNVKKSKSGNSAITGGKDKGKVEKKAVVLKLSVEKIEYVSSEDEIRIQGKTVEPHDDVPLNSYHTAEILLTKSLTIFKDNWDQLSYETLVKACAIENKAEIGAVVMEEGVAHVCLVTDSMTVLRNKVEKSIPKKRRGENGGGNHDKALEKFYDLVSSTILRNLDIEKLKVILLASPGFTASCVLNYMSSQAAKEENKVFFANKSKFLVVHSSTGYLQGLEEVMKDPSVQSQLKDTQFAKEAKIFEEFQKSLNADDDKAWYGLEEVEKAIDMGAVKYLMITDTLFRNDDPDIRRHYIQLTENVKFTGGEVYIFSSQHESGEQLDKLTGVAALLSYPVPDLDEDSEDEN